MSFGQSRKILAEVSNHFVIQGLQNGELRALAEEVLANSSRGSKRASPLRALMVVWLVVAMALYRSQSIANVFQKLLYWIGRAEPMLGRRPVTPEALYHARERLGASPLKLLFRAVVARYLDPVEATFRGFREWVIDGSEFTVADTKLNEVVFGRHRSDRGAAAYPQVRGVFLVAAARHQIRDCSFLPSSSSEHAVVPYLLRNLGPGDLLMVDRGLTSFRLLLECQQAGVHVLVRISSTWKPQTVRRLGPGDTLVRIRPCNMARTQLKKQDKSATVVARLLEFQVGSGGDVVRLLTDLVDPSQFSALELAAQYHRRWECELTYKELKLELLAVTEGKQKTHFRSKTPIGVLQEAWGAALAQILVRELMIQGAEAAGVPALTISFVDSLEVIKLMLPDLQIATEKQMPGLRAKLLREIGQCLIDRPRRERSFSRVIKRKMSNYKLKGPNDGERRLDLQIRFVQTK